MPVAANWALKPKKASIAKTTVLQLLQLVLLKCCLVTPASIPRNDAMPKA